jgi:hypothetical protein
LITAITNWNVVPLDQTVYLQEALQDLKTWNSSQLVNKIVLFSSIFHTFTFRIINGQGNVQKG